MVDMENIDFDEGKMRLNGEWLAIEDIKEAIKEKVASNDFDVADYSIALKDLARTLEGSREFTFRLPADVIGALEEMSQRQSDKLGNCLRKALKGYLKGEGFSLKAPEISEPASSEEPAEEEEEDESEEEESEEEDDEEEEDESEEEESEEEDDEEVRAPYHRGRSRRRRR
jgi:hypothetical protein